MASIKDTSLPSRVISYRHKHGVDILTATGDNLLSILGAIRSKRLQKAITALTEKDLVVRSHRGVCKALQVVVCPTESAESLSLALYGEREGHDMSLLPLEAWRAEALVWLGTNTVDAPVKLVKTLADSYSVSDSQVQLIQRIFDELACFALARDRLKPVVVYSADTLDQAKEYHILLNDNWKPESIAEPKKLENIYARYLRFFNELIGGFELERIADEADYVFDVY